MFMFTFTSNVHQLQLPKTKAVDCMRVAALPLRNIQPYDNPDCPLLSLHRTEMVPRRNTTSCDQGTASPADTGFDSKSADMPTLQTFQQLLIINIHEHAADYAVDGDKFSTLIYFRCSSKAAQ